ncbi:MULTISPECIES: alginate export family protein [unclassified Sphingomonas]|uniref:alginate export family protein n=1 Tax=unclassified Sphingomonas TaxID=196159 RepID=UPI0009EB02DA|nr:MULTISPECIES: alginate export family protein [unclassified Sphingomonas]
MIRHRVAAAAGLCQFAVAAPALAQGREAWQPPTLTNTRYDEDWSKLGDPAARTGHWTEAFKYVPLDRSGSTWLTTGIELRLRSESFDDNLWGGAAAPDDGYLWSRALPYADLHVGRVRAFVQPVAAFTRGVAPSAGPIDQTRVDLLQGFAEVSLPIGGDTEVTLRGGRQMLSLGTERLIGTRYGPNVPLAFDGARADIVHGAVTVSLFMVQPVRPGTGSFDDRSSPTKKLWGGYARLPGLDLYYLGYRNRDASFAGLTGQERRHSLGLRSHGTAGEWHWNVEGVYQFGHFAEQRISAWTVGSEVGRHFPDMPLAPHAVVRFNVVSGDKSASDDTLGTFNALFPKGKYFGELSPVGPYNIVSLNPSLSLAVARDLSLGIAAMAYWRYSRADGIYDIPGNLIRPATASTGGNARSRFIGKEAEASLSWQATPELELSASLSAFQAGGFIRQSGPARTIGMLGLEANFRI